MNHNIPHSEQRPELPDDWFHPVTTRVRAVLEAAVNDELFLKERALYGGEPTRPDEATQQLGSGRSEAIEYILHLNNGDGIEVASIHQITGDGVTINISFEFSGDDEQRHPGDSSVNFGIENDGSVIVRSSVSLNDPERLLDPSQLAIPIMREVNNSLDGLLTAWIIHPERFNFQIFDIDEVPYPEELAKAHRKLIAAMLGVTALPEE